MRTRDSYRYPHRKWERSTPVFLTGNEDNAAGLSVKVHKFPHLLSEGVVWGILAPALVPHLHLRHGSIKPVLPALGHPLKVHKNKNFFGFNLEFCTISFRNESSHALTSYVFRSFHIFTACNNPTNGRSSFYLLQALQKNQSSSGSHWSQIWN